jgi:hypothetical protein
MTLSYRPYTDNMRSHESLHDSQTSFLKNIQSQCKWFCKSALVVDKWPAGSSHYRGQIKPKSINVHFSDPVPATIIFSFVREIFCWSFTLLMRTSKDELHIQKNLAVLKHHKLHISTLQVWFVLGWNENKSHLSYNCQALTLANKSRERRKKYLRQSTINRRTMGWLQLNVFPQPE